MKLSVTLFSCLALFFPAIALAELPRQVELDFAPISGTVIMPINDEYLVDLDDRDNMYVGDILTLVEPGQKIFHPETREILGVVDTPIGFLQVTRINSGYSYVKPITEGLKADNGARVKRFEQVPAVFIDNQEDDGVVARQIQMDLPQFKWLPQNAADQALLTFVLKTGALDVKTAGGNYLHNYAITSDLRVETPPAPARRPFVESSGPEPKVLQQAANALLGLVNLSDEEYKAGRNIAIIRQGAGRQSGLWMSPNIEGNPVGVAVADLDGDGRQEIALALNNKLLIARIVEGQYEQLAVVEVPLLLQAISLDAFDLDGNGRPELYLSAIGGFRPSSMVIEFTGTDYEIVIRHINWYLRVVDTADRGQAVIGQLMDTGKSSFTGKPFFVQREGDRLVRGEKFKLPGLLNIYSFVPFTDKENRQFYAHLTESDHLKVVSAEGVDLWESEDYFGGSESCFNNQEQTTYGEIIIPTCIRPRIMKTPSGEILVVQNDGQRLMQRYKIYKKSRLVSLNWNGFALIQNWRTADQQGYLGDFTVADADNDGRAELVMGVKFQHKTALNDARSSIVVFDFE